ncbi:hypothetical protein BpHYR1_025650 [Brachionus plicatilis]|uniref:Uncharacterized protein n=1 Tax=Brachionus plicatilis TaxID=10195 RepID=A0A3M7SU46_BRAPC|nr:hypothetical protein BpHYR1_025650 [Brachionus plicatilis]
MAKCYLLEEKKILKSKNLKKFSFKKRILKKLSLFIIRLEKEKSNWRSSINEIINHYSWMINSAGIQNSTKRRKFRLFLLWYFSGKCDVVGEWNKDAVPPYHLIISFSTDAQ